MVVVSWSCTIIFGNDDPYQNGKKNELKKSRIAQYSLIPWAPRGPEAMCFPHENAQIVSQGMDQISLLAVFYTSDRKSSQAYSLTQMRKDPLHKIRSLSPKGFPMLSFAAFAGWREIPYRQSYRLCTCAFPWSSSPEGRRWSPDSLWAPWSVRFCGLPCPPPHPGYIVSCSHEPRVKAVLVRHVTELCIERMAWTTGRFVVWDPKIESCFSLFFNKPNYVLFIM